MILTDIRLQQYRSYTDDSFELGEGVNIVVGPNAAGKTNLLEAIMVSCTGKSYRAKDLSLLQNEKDWARIDTHTSDNIQRTVKLQFDSAGRLQKTFEINDKTFKRLPENLKQPVVLFEPNNLLLIEGEPSLRRAYLDHLLEQFVPGYEIHQAHYKRALSQRNALLKQGARGSSQLFAWNLRLADLGEQLVKNRVKLIATINERVNAVYESISKHDKLVNLKYDSSLDTTNYSTNLLKKLESTTELDMARGFTGNGPHRDDFTVFFKKLPALNSASRGEVRTLLLALKTIELELLEKELGTRPILLLDDVFSELDGARRRALTSVLENYQTVITTTDADIVVKHFTGSSNTIPLA